MFSTGLNGSTPPAPPYNSIIINYLQLISAPTYTMSGSLCRLNSDAILAGNRACAQGMRAIDGSLSWPAGIHCSITVIPECDSTSMCGRANGYSQTPNLVTLWQANKQGQQLYEENS